MEFLLSAALFCVGLYAAVVKRNLMKVTIGVAVMGYSVNLFVMLAGFRFGSLEPIISKAAANVMTVDPLAQALVLAAVTLGLCVTLLLAALSLKLYEKYGTFDITEIRKLKG